MLEEIKFEEVKAISLKDKKEVNILFEPKKDTRQHLMLGNAKVIKATFIDYIEYEKGAPGETPIKNEIFFMNKKDGESYMVKEWEIVNILS